MELKTGQVSEKSRTFLPSQIILNVSEKRNIKRYVCDFQLPLMLVLSSKTQPKVFKYGNYAFVLKLKLVSKFLKIIF